MKLHPHIADSGSCHRGNRFFHRAPLIQAKLQQPKKTPRALVASDPLAQGHPTSVDDDEPDKKSGAGRDQDENKLEGVFEHGLEQIEGLIKQASEEISHGLKIGIEV